MTPENFCYWLQGYMEINGKGSVITVEQQRIIQEHLKLVFDKKTPERKLMSYEGLTPFPYSPGLSNKPVC